MQRALGSTDNLHAFRVRMQEEVGTEQVIIEEKVEMRERTCNLQ